MDDLNLLIKPASGLCNMACRYCFYREELEHYGELRMQVMPEETMALLIEKACGEARYALKVTFQGGEPTLAGLDYFRRFTALVREKKRRTAEVAYSLQTNGLLLDEEWADFLARNHFLVGLSYDGTPRFHDANRTDRGGAGTAERVERAWKLLRKHGVETNLLCVVTGQAAKKPGQVYRHMKEMGASYLQFIPCISPEGDPSQPAGQWQLSPDAYAYFLKTVFDLWYQDWQNGLYISVRHLDDYMRLLMGRCPSSCAAMGQCGGYFVVENDGSVYPCDFFVSSERCLGNIRDASFAQLADSAKMAEFLTETYKPEKCRKCAYYGLCRGGCKNDYRPVGDGRENVYCGAYQDFFSYALGRMLKIRDAAAAVK